MAAAPDWVWPVCRHPDGRAPAISDGYDSPRDKDESGTVTRRHRGVDVMYRRPAEVPSSVYKLEHGSAWHEMPRGTAIVAPRAGRVWSVGETSRGWGVVLDHGAPWATFHQHLERVYVRKGQQVGQGQPLGIGGHGSLGDIRHLHFAMWKDGSGDDAAVDPEPLMRQWPVLARPRLAFDRGALVAAGGLVGALAVWRRWGL